MKPQVILKTRETLKMSFKATCDPFFLDDQPIKLPCRSEWDVYVVPKGYLDPITDLVFDSNKTIEK